MVVCGEWNLIFVSACSGVHGAWRFVDGRWNSHVAGRREGETGVTCFKPLIRTYVRPILICNSNRKTSFCFLFMIFVFCFNKYWYLMLSPQKQENSVLSLAQSVYPSHSSIRLVDSHPTTMGIPCLFLLKTHSLDCNYRGSFPVSSPLITDGDWPTPPLHFQLEIMEQWS